MHGINLLPVTPLTELLLSPDYVAAEYPVLARALRRAPPAPAVADGWKGFAVADLAVLDPDAAWAAAAALGSFDDGASRANLLHWIATRPEGAPCPNCTLVPAGGGGLGDGAFEAGPDDA